MNKERDIWVDRVKIIACILVVLGHFYQSMVKAGLASDHIIYQWFISTIYLFHVQLFFICSGYLYQKYSNVNSIRIWGNNILNKFLALGIPYFVFSTITWILKKLFSSSVNSQLGGLLHTLFIEPTSPYWYLYILFFLFVITFTCHNKRNLLILFSIGLLCRIILMFGFSTGIYILGNIASNWIWFIAGMLLAEDLIPLAGIRISIILLLLFTLFSILAITDNLHFRGYDFIMGVIACYSIVSIVNNLVGYGAFSSSGHRYLIKYTMPIFLMHTMFAAPIRILLLILNITSIPVHIIIGLLASYLGPIVTMLILEKLHPLDFIVYPSRYIKFHA